MSDEEIQTEADEMVDDGPPDIEKDERVNESDENILEEADGSAPNNGEEPSAQNTPTDFERETDTANQEDIEDLTLKDIDLPDDGFDEEDETSGGKRKWVLIGSSIVLLAILGGAGFYYFNNQNLLTKNGKPAEVALSLKIPSKSKLKKGRKKMISSSKKLLQKNPPSLNLKSPKNSKSPDKLKSINKPKPAGNAKKLQTSSKKNKSPDLKTKSNGKKNKKTLTQDGKAVQSTSGAKILADGSLVLPSVTAAAFKGIPMIKNPRPLADPDKSLGESMGGGVIPKISTDGRRPWKFYGKSFNKQTTLPRVGIIIRGLGFSRAATTAAINQTPSEVTLAFNPYAKGVGNWVGLARAVGHETLITLPMEPIDFPISDPGPFALQVDLKQTENIDRLRYILSVSMGNVGLLQMMGTRFVNSRKALEPILKEISSRGLLMIDDGLARKSQISSIASTIGLPRARSDVFLDQDASRASIMQKLSALEATAKKNKSAIGIAQPLPNSISLIMNWTKTLAQKNLVLAPISAIVKISGSLKPKANASSGVAAAKK
jgi:polysaccharide deacetylase 2 family uncharacterized protein YibQ